MGFHEGKWLRRRIAKAKHKQTAIARRLGVHVTTVQKWIAADRLKIDLSNRAALAEAIGLSLEGFDKELFDASAGSGSVSEMLVEGVPIGESGETLNSHGRVVNTERPSGKLIKYAPLVGRVAAGPLSDFVDLDYPAGFADQMIPVVAGDADVFAFYVDGDSMSPRFLEGDVVVCRVIEGHESILNGGAYVFCEVKDGETKASFKLLVRQPKKRDSFIATPINSAHKTFEIRRADMHKLGHVSMVLPRQR